VVSFTPRPLYPRCERPRCPLDRRLGEPQSRSGFDGEKKIPAPCQESNPSRPARSLVTILTELNGLLLNDADLPADVIQNRMRWKDDHQWSVGKKLEGGGRGLFQGWCSIICLKIQKQTRVTANPADIPTRYLPNTECYRYTNLLDELGRTQKGNSHGLIWCNICLEGLRQTETFNITCFRTEAVIRNLLNTKQVCFLLYTVTFGI
jgi:hypothetical protein